MSEVAQKFIDQLKQQNLLEAIEVIKEELASRARKTVEDVNFTVAESFKMSRIVEADDEEEEDEDEEEDEGDDDKNKGKDDE